MSRFHICVVGYALYILLTLAYEHEGLPVFVCCFMFTVSSQRHVGTVSYLSTLSLDKPHRGSLPVFSAQSFGSNCILAHFESAEENKISTKECAGRRFDLGSDCIRSGHAADKDTVPVYLSSLN